MIDTFRAKTNGKTLVVKIDGMIVKIGEPQSNGKKPKLIDIAMGNPSMIINDLKSQGYNIKYL